MRVTAELEDVNGSFAKLIKNGPLEFRKELAAGVRRSGFTVAARMRSKAPVGPDAPHIRDTIEVVTQGMTTQVGYFSDSEQASVALYNEYRPNKQPFMRAALEDENKSFTTDATKACLKAEHSLSSEI